MSAQTLGVGVVGTGFVGPAHIEALRRINLPVVGVAASTAKEAQERANTLGVSQAYPSYQEMLADPAVSVVHLATPNHLHYSQAKAALEAGKHVVCEKPLAMDSHESAELVQLALEKNRLGVVNFNLRFYPLVYQAREMLSQGRLGEVFLIHGSYLQDWLLYPTDWNWRLQTDLGGSLRAVADIGSHWLDMVTFVTGLGLEAVMADFKTAIPVRKRPRRDITTFTNKLVDTTDTVDEPISTEDYASILLRFENGAHGVVSVSQVSAGRKNRLSFEIDGAQAAIAWDSERPNELWIGHRDRPNEILMKDPSLLDPEARAITSYPGGHIEGYADTFKQLYIKVYRYIRAGDFHAPTDFPTFQDGHEEILIGEKIERSAKEGRWINIRS